MRKKLIVAAGVFIFILGSLILIFSSSGSSVQSDVEENSISAESTLQSVTVRDIKSNTSSTENNDTETIDDMHIFIDSSDGNDLEESDKILVSEPENP